MADWIAADWPAAACIHAGTSLRTGGVSLAPYESLNLGDHVGDEASAVIENRRRLRDRCGLPTEPHWLQQVHGTAVAVLPGPVEAPPADASMTSAANVVCAVLSADCLPVLLARKDGSAVAAAHAGWRGLLDGVLEATVSALDARSGVLAWLGPAISQAAFEVGPEVRDAFVARSAASAVFFGQNDAGRWQADLYSLARQRLRAAGVSDIYGGGRCTFAEPASFFSYRRDGQCGRMASFIYRSE